MKIGFMGMGFVGGTTAKVLESVHEIIPYDIDPKKGYLENLLKLKDAEAIFLSVPTPMMPSGKIDYSPIKNSLETLTEVTQEMNNKPLVIIRSTAVSGTTDSLEQKYPFDFAFNPEFLREKFALEDMKNTNRIIIGANKEECGKKVEDIYKSMNIDYNTIKNAVLLDERIGRNLNVPGHDGDLGFGGKCFPKDLNALIYLARENNYRPYFLEEAWRLNERLRKNKDWLEIKGAISENCDFKK